MLSTHVPRIVHRPLASSEASMRRGAECFVCCSHYCSTSMQFPRCFHQVHPRCKQLLDPKILGPMTVSDPTILSHRRPQHPHLGQHRQPNQPTKVDTRLAQQSSSNWVERQEKKQLQSRSRPKQWIRGKLCSPNQSVPGIRSILLSLESHPQLCLLCQCWLHLSESSFRSIGSVSSCTADAARNFESSRVFGCNVSKRICRLSSMCLCLLPSVL